MRARFLYDKDSLSPVAELDSDGNVVARLVYGTAMAAPDNFSDLGPVPPVSASLPPRVPRRACARPPPTTC